MMETLKFKTNIKCGACVATVTPFLNEDNAVENWNVDLQSPERILKVETSKSPQEIAELMKKAGYNAEEIA
ncbi:heavy-metal-associated domain-containing protein [Dyadobacter chenhuakuii]